MSDNMKLWDALKQPPPTALKEIQAGRLKGKSDINPQWRYQAMTEQFGPCGLGWKYTIDRLWTEPAGKDEVFAFALISVYWKIGEPDIWSDPIPGIGGSMLMEMESKGLHASDEGYKMAVTDALSVAMKMLGVAADVYMGKWDGSKYVDRSDTKATSQPPPPKNEPGASQGKPPAFFVPKKHDDLDQRQMQVAIDKMLTEMYGEDAAAQLERLTSFTGKDGKQVPGKRNVYEIQTKPNASGETFTSLTYIKVRTEYAKWEAGRKEASGELV
jgi:hypothetical protein